MSRYAAKNKTNEFWTKLAKMAEKSGKIDTIDARINPTKYTGPATSIDTRQRTPSKEVVSHMRG